MRVAFLLGYGLLPLWAAVALIVLAFAVMRSDLAGESLWALLVAVPACAVTLAITWATTRTYAEVSGSRARRLTLASGVFAAANATLVVAAASYWLAGENRTDVLRKEKSEVETFVSLNEVVRSAAGEPLRASVSLSTFVRSAPLPSRYEVSVAGAQTVYALVEVDRRVQPATFKLLCIMRRSQTQQDSQVDACSQ